MHFYLVPGIPYALLLSARWPHQSQGWRSCWSSWPTCWRPAVTRPLYADCHWAATSLGNVAGKKHIWRTVGTTTLARSLSRQYWAAKAVWRQPFRAASSSTPLTALPTLMATWPASTAPRASPSGRRGTQSTSPMLPTGTLLPVLLRLSPRWQATPVRTSCAAPSSSLSSPGRMRPQLPAPPPDGSLVCRWMEDGVEEHH